MLYEHFIYKSVVKQKLFAKWIVVSKRDSLQIQNETQIKPLL
jgi:hypothetical protein